MATILVAASILTLVAARPLDVSGKVNNKIKLVCERHFEKFEMTLLHISKNVCCLQCC